MKLKELKTRSIVKLFTKEECDKILKSVEKNSNSIEYVKFVDLYKLVIDGYRIQGKSLDKDIERLILDRVEGLCEYEVEQCFILKYGEETKLSMKPHYDICDYTLVINLNNDFEGGETNFPLTRFKFKPQEHEVGSALFFNGNTRLSWHEALPVTSGVKYSLNVKYRNRNGFIIINILKPIQLFLTHLALALI